MSFIDIHCHLHFQRIAGCVESVLINAKKAGIRHFVINSTGEGDWEKVNALARCHEEIVPCYGIHPYQITDECSIARLKEFCSCQTGPYWIGEIGMDKSISKRVSMDKQAEFFEKQVCLAKELNVPFAVHCVKCVNSIFEILARHGPFAKGFLMHGYSGSPDYISKFTELGAYFSISGYFFNLALNRQKAMQDVIRKIPQDRLLFESDAPDMVVKSDDKKFTITDDEQGLANTPNCILEVYIGRE